MNFVESAENNESISMLSEESLAVSDEFLKMANTAEDLSKKLADYAFRARQNASNIKNSETAVIVKSNVKDYEAEMKIYVRKSERFLETGISAVSTAGMGWDGDY